MAPSLDQVADELYGLALEDFTAARTRYEKEARQAGDRELAATVHHLGKPNVAAWLANQLVRERRDELQALSALGASLRQATDRLAGDELRQLSRQQHELVYALVQQARQLARDAGRTVSDDTARSVEETLHAALADEYAAEQLLAGRLTEPLHRSGFGDWAAPGSAPPFTGITARTAGPTAAPAPTPLLDHHVDLAKAARETAKRALRDAATAEGEARTRADQADRAAEAAQNEVLRLRQRLDAAVADADEAQRHRQGRAAALAQAEQALSDAERRYRATQGAED